MLNAQQIDHRLPFGRHKDLPLSDVPSDYLDWLMRSCKLSSGLRLAIGNELRRRNLTRLRSHRQGADLSMRIGQVPRGLDRGPTRPEAHPSDLLLWPLSLLLAVGRTVAFVRNENLSPTAILDVLTRLEDLGIDLQCDGRKAWVSAEDYRKVPADLHVVIRQCSNTLARMIGKRTA